MKQIFFTALCACIFICQSCTKPAATGTAAALTTESQLVSGDIKEGTYKVNIASKSTIVMSIAQQSVDDNIPVAVTSYNPDSTGTLWHFTPVAGGFFRISNAYSGKVLQAPSDAGGATLIQNRYDTSDYQLWQLVNFNNNMYRIVNKANGLSVAVSNTGNTKGNVQQQQSANTALQAWQLTPVDAIYVDVDATNFFRRTEGWIASDGAASVQMNDGRVAWFMGDSHIDDYFYNSGKIYCLFQVRNAALLQPASHSFNWKETSTLTGNALPGIQSYLKNKPDDDHWMWLGCGFQPDGNDTMYVYNQPLVKTGSTEWSYADDGPPVWAKITTGNMKVVTYSPLQDFNGINFGAGFVKEDDGYIYAYGIKTTFIYANIYVARFPAIDPNAAWEFWTGSNWSNDVKNIQRVSEGASFGIAVTKVNNKYIAVSTEFSVGCDQGTALYASVSSSPTGPFTNRKPFYYIPDRLEGHTPFFYAPNIHPQFMNQNNELLVTYDVNGYGDCVSTCNGGKTYPDYYRPRAIRVPASVLKGK